LLEGQVRSISYAEIADAEKPELARTLVERVGADKRGSTGESLSQATTVSTTQTAIREFKRRIFGSWIGE
jgi:hypothetical protein